MTVIKDLRERVEQREERADETCSCDGSSWAEELGLPILLVAIAVMAYGCEAAKDHETRRKTYEACAGAKDLTPTCDAIIRNR